MAPGRYGLVWFAARPFFQRQRLEWQCEITRLAEHGRGFGDGLRITWDGGTLVEPQVVLIRLASRSARDIAPEAFVSGAPLVIKVGTKLVALLGPEAGGIDAVGDEILVLPQLIRRKQLISLTALVDGEPAVNIADPPLVDVEVAERPWDYLASRNARLAYGLVGLVAAVLGVLGAISAYHLERSG